MKASKQLLICALTTLLSAVWGAGWATAADLDPADYRGRLTVDGVKVPYYRTTALKHRNEDVDRAIIAIHGMSRRADRTWKRMFEAAELVNQEQSTLILAPLFPFSPKAEDELEFLMAENDEAYWFGGWRQGHKSADSSKVSSFRVVDYIYEQLCDAKRFPNLKTIILVGHSAGGQFTNRYAAAGKALVRQGVSRRFVVMNPSSYLYLSDKRVGVDGDYFLYKPKGIYNDYKYGLDNLNAYAGAVGVAALRHNLTTRKVYYLAGTADIQLDGGLDVTWSAMVQGFNRYGRFQRYEFHCQTFNADWQHNSAFLSVAGVAHKEDEMYESGEGLMVLFL